MKDARHPCLEKQEELSFIPNDLFFEKGLFCNVLLLGFIHNNNEYLLILYKVK